MVEKYSGKRVIKAGEQLITSDIYENDAALNAEFDVLAYWRFSHERALENALSLLKKTTLEFDRKAIFAKRLKRFISIVVKLKRFPDMKLKNMQDIGGCRAIVANPKKLQQIVRELRRRPEFKNGNGKIRYKDYIKTPKDDGYRGYHLIGQFDNGGSSKRNIELQIRTGLQHDWATTLEIVDLFTGQALKSNQGDHDWKEFFSSVSEQFSLMEDIHLFDTFELKDKYSSYRDKLLSSDDGTIQSCAAAKLSAKKLNVVKKLEAYSNSLKIIDGRIGESSLDGYALIEVDTNKNTLTTCLFKKDENRQAEEKYVEAEKIATEQPHLVVALVSTTAVGGIKEAYPNYFADSTDFIEHLLCIVKVDLEKKKSFFTRLFS